MARPGWAALLRGSSWLPSQPVCCQLSIPRSHDGARLALGRRRTGVWEPEEVKLRAHSCPCLGGEHSGNRSPRASGLQVLGSVRKGPRSSASTGGACLAETETLERKSLFLGQWLLSQT